MHSFCYKQESNRGKWSLYLLKYSDSSKHWNGTGHILFPFKQWHPITLFCLTDKLQAKVWKRFRCMTHSCLQCCKIFSSVSTWDIAITHGRTWPTESQLLTFTSILNWWLLQACGYIRGCRFSHKKLKLLALSLT